MRKVKILALNLPTEETGDGLGATNRLPIYAVALSPKLEVTGWQNDVLP